MFFHISLAQYHKKNVKSGWFGKKYLKKGRGGEQGGHLEGLSIEWRLKSSVRCGTKFKKLV